MPLRAQIWVCARNGRCRRGVSEPEAGAATATPAAATAATAGQGSDGKQDDDGPDDGGDPGAEVKEGIEGADVEQGHGEPAAGRSSPGGADAGRALVTVSTSSAGVQCPVSGASVQCPRVPVHATAVQCPMQTSERPGVRRPVSSVDVRCPSVPASAVSDREVVEGGGVAGSREASGWTWPSSWEVLSSG
jgi:hypothetical protein